jgi:hypothetical protein
MARARIMCSSDIQAKSVDGSTLVRRKFLAPESRTCNAAMLQIRPNFRRQLTRPTKFLDCHAFAAAAAWNSLGNHDSLASRADNARSMHHWKPDWPAWKDPRKHGGGSLLRVHCGCA